MFSFFLNDDIALIRECAWFGKHDMYSLALKSYRVGRSVAIPQLCDWLLKNALFVIACVMKMGKAWARDPWDGVIREARRH